MSTKSKTHALHGSHTAGIFADMSIDGPQIGTLVIIIDRAKNLPNRKTIGKQDPYCAARLGKEAKKTGTDIRGGQTPKWDQELRFTVHDSPDYYQLKISVFTDDKKTDLIGEAWIDLKTIIVSGGGQSDMWQTLMCKGKYAGELRLEITFYDSRPKPDKPPAAQMPPLQSDREGGSVKQKTPMRRRPLPSEPTTGMAPSPPPSVPSLPSSHSSPDLHQHTPRPHTFVPTHSPLQAVEFHASSHSPRQHVEHHPSPQSCYSTSTSRVDGPRPEGPRQPKDATPPQAEESGYGQKTPASHAGFMEPRRHHSQPPETQMDMPAAQDPAGLDDMRPPTPPVHRSRHGSGASDLPHHGAHESPSQKPATSPSPMRHDVLKQEALKHSSPSYPGRPAFRAYDSAPSAPVHGSPPAHHPCEQMHPRYHSYDSTYSPHQRSMQATVEDAPESPPTSLPHSYRQSGLRMRSHDDMVAEASARHGNARSTDLDVEIPRVESPQHMDHPPTYRGFPQQNSRAFLPAASQSFPVDSNRAIYQSYIPPKERLELQSDLMPGYQRHLISHNVPDIPPSLLPGVDPGLSKEISELIYDDEFYERTRGTSIMAMATRGRRMIEGPPPTDSAGHHSLGNSPSQLQGRQHSSEVSYSGAPRDETTRQMQTPRNASPQHAIRRKSVSPSPGKSTEIPFGPDSYDALNPALASSGEATPANDTVLSGGKIITHDGKEVDPSDHLPMETWAPEPESRAHQLQSSSEPRTRPWPSGAQPMPLGGRRQLRVAQPQSTVTAHAHERGFEDISRALAAPATTNRNRLQKRANRSTMVSYAPTSSPLAPVSADRLQDRQLMHLPRAPHVAASPWDYANENHVLHAGYGPTVPAKMALPAMSGGSGMVDYGLMEEMQSIDIGAGRSRRRGGGY